MRSIKQLIGLILTACLPLQSLAVLDLAQLPLNLGKAAPPYIMLMVDDSGSMLRNYIPENALLEGGDISILRDPSINKLYYNPNYRYLPRLNSDGTPYENAPSTTTYDLITEGSDNTQGSRDRQGSRDDQINTNVETQPHYYINGQRIVITNSNEIDNFNNWYAYYRTREDTAKTSLSHVLSTLPDDYQLGLWIMNQNLDTLAPTIPITEFTQDNRALFYNALFSIASDGGTPLRSTLQGIGDYFENHITDTLACRGYYSIFITDGYWNGSAPGVGNVDGQAHKEMASGGNVLFDYKPVYPYADDTPNTLADVALHYWYRDLRPDLTNIVPAGSNDLANWQRLINYTIGFGFEEAITNKPPAVWPSVSSDQETNIYDLWHAAVNSRGNYYNASDPQFLSQALQDIVQQISSLSRSTSSEIAIDSSSVVGKDATVYQAIFNSKDWSGDILSFPMSANSGNINQANPKWQASEKMPKPDERVIFTNNMYTQKAVSFTNQTLNNTHKMELASHQFTFYPTNFTRWKYWVRYNSYNYTFPLGSDDDDESEFGYFTGNTYYNYKYPYLYNTTTKKMGGSLFGLTTEAATYTKQLIDYVRGSASLEDGTTFRRRSRATPEQAPLADIINSSVTYVATVPPHNYPDSLTQYNYSDFKQQFKDNPNKRDPMIYVAANDGMLHGFSAKTGREEMAYIPSFILNKLGAHGDLNSTHQYLTDGTPTINDAYYNNAWHTVLVSGQGAGAQGIYALDVTTTDFSQNIAGNKVLWEFSDADDSDLGNTYGKLSVNLFNNNRWGVIVHNGYNSDAPDGYTGDGQAVLYILFLDRGYGPNYVKIEASSLKNNGLSEASAVDIQGQDGKPGSDHRVDYIYAGDLQGNLWKFDVTSQDPSQWGVARDGDGNQGPLFTTRQVSDGTVTRAQPITASIEVGKHPNGGQMVYFGTGQYITNDDPQTLFENNFYAVWDNGIRLNIKPDQLLTQSLLYEQAKESETVRISTNHTIAWDSGTDPGEPTDGDLGWKILLNPPGTTTPIGERVVHRAVLNSGYVFFNTLIPQSNLVCSQGEGNGWFMALNAVDGGRTAKSPIDINNDAEINDEDLITLNDGRIFALSGIASNVGLPTSPHFVKLKEGLNKASFAGSNGLASYNTLGTIQTKGRQSWRMVVGQ